MESGSVVDSVSFNPSGDADNASPWPSSILLAEEAYVAISRNDTTASAKSRAGHTVEVTFWVADPPAVSFCTFHWSKPGISDCEDADLEVQPHVVGAQGRFILLCTRFSGDDEDEYFIYKGDPESPSLESVPLPDDDRLLIASEFGIVPRGDRGHYLLVALCDAVKMKDYILHIFLSEDRTWRTKELLNPCPGVYTITPEKVFMLQDGMLCWVDLRRGMLVCDVLQEPLHARYIPLPEPLPANRPKVEQFLPAARPSLFRDVTYADGIIKFIEIEHRFITKEIRDVPAEKLFNPRHKDVLYDSDLIMLSKHIDMDIKPKILRSVNGWSAMTWTREVGSNCWLKGCDFDVDDILVGHSVHPASYNSQSLEFKNMYLACPTLSNANELYLRSFMKFGNSNGSACVVVVDLAEKTLKAEALGGYPFGRRYAPIQQVFHLCALSNYLKRTTAIKISECEITQLGSSLKEPNNTAVCVGEPDSYESENKHLSECEITQLGSSSNEPNNTAVCVCEPGSYGSENKRISECETTQLRSSSNEPNNTAVCVGEPDSYEPENKRPRLSAKKVNYAQNEAQSLVQNVLSSQVHPEQNNMPPQHFNRWEGPGYCGNWGYTSWPHQSNMAPPQCFNTCGEPFNPVYAPSAPGLNMHSYSNYQSLCQQPSLSGSSKQHLAGPYEPPQHFNRWEGPGYCGNRGYPSWPHQSNTAPPQCFNTWGEPFNPEYAPSAPGLNMHSYSNYQSLWQQPSLLGSSKQHLAGPYEAPRPCLKDWSGASYRGNSQQFPAGNSYCYGARSGNGNYNQR